MTKERVLLLPGWSSSGSLKRAYLGFLGYDVLTPRLSDWWFSRAVTKAQAAYEAARLEKPPTSENGGEVF